MTQAIANIITLQALTFLHPGTGQNTGVVDLPVQREVYSGHPMYASSGFKGSLRDKAEQKWSADSDEVVTLFGANADEQGGTTAGALIITDGRILAFPVRSLQNVFAWITCPMVIKRLQRDATISGIHLDSLSTVINASPATNAALVSPESNFFSPLILEEMAFTIEKNDAVQAVGNVIQALTGDTGFAPERLVIVTDDDFTYFVEYATQISARIKLNSSKTTTGGGGNLWYEETLPPETILYGFALSHPPRSTGAGLSSAEDVENTLTALVDDNYLQIGGNETVGQGWCHVNLSRGEV